MRRTKRVSRTGSSVNPVEAEKRHARWEPGYFQESGTGTFSYTTQTVLHDPRTGRRVPASVGIVVSEGSVMMWLKT